MKQRRDFHGPGSPSSSAPAGRSFPARYLLRAFTGNAAPRLTSTHTDEGDRYNRIRA